MMRMMNDKPRQAATRPATLGALLTVMMLCAAMLLTPASARAGDKPQSLTLTIGKASTVDVPGEVADLLVANPDVADVGVLKSDRIYVVGRNVGDTNVLAFDANGNTVAEYNVHVRVDEATLKKTLKQYFPDEKVKIETVGNDIILSGDVSSADKAGKVREVAQRFLTDANSQALVDMMMVEGAQQVMLKVRILEVNRSRLKELGTELNYNVDLTDSFGNFTAGFDTDSSAGLSGSTAFGSGALVYQTNSFGPLSAFIQALDQDDIVNILAEPNLTARSGEEAFFLAGGEFPVPASVDQNGNVTVEFREFGTSLQFRPVVMSPNRISLQLTTEVSTVDPTNSVTLQGLSVPGRQIRRAATSVEMASGGTLMIAGLLNSRDVKSYAGLPGVGHVPVIGDLMRSDSFERQETEVVMIVTPFLVNPYAEKQAEIATVGPLGRAFLNNLRKTYGDRVPDVATTGLPFGYLID